MTLNPFRPAQFLGDIELPGMADPGLGPIAGYTNNYAFNLVNFDWTTWNSYEWQNWQQTDTLLNTVFGLLGVSGIRGVWQPNTEYEINDVVFDPDELTSLYLCVVAHTSSSDFATDIPLYWEANSDLSTGLITLLGPLPRIQFTNDLIAAPDGRFRIVTASDGTFRIEQNTAVEGDFSAVDEIARFEPSGTAMIDAQAVVTKEKGDARFMGLTGAQSIAGHKTFTDKLTLNIDDDEILSFPLASGGTPRSVEMRNNAFGGLSNLRFRLSGSGLTDAFIFSKYDQEYIALLPGTRQILTDGGGPLIAADEFRVHRTSATTQYAQLQSGDASNGPTVLFRAADTSRPAVFQTTTINQFQWKLDTTTIATLSNGAFTHNVGNIQFIDSGNRIVYFESGEFFQFFRSNVEVMRVDAAGTGASSGLVSTTREKGDARYAAISSERFKENVVDRTDIDALAILAQIGLKSWQWGGVLPPTDERYGRPGLGLSAEILAQIRPELATYQWVQRGDGTDDRNGSGRRQILGVDVSALLAVVIQAVNRLAVGVTALEQAGGR